MQTEDSEGSGRQRDGAKKRQSALNRESRKAIGRQLQSLYDEVVQEPIPDRFAQLLQRLQEAEDKPSGS